MNSRGRCTLTNQPVYFAWFSAKTQLERWRFSCERTLHFNIKCYLKLSWWWTYSQQAYCTVSRIKYPKNYFYRRLFWECSVNLTLLSLETSYKFSQCQTYHWVLLQWKRDACKTKKWTLVLHTENVMEVATLRACVCRRIYQMPEGGFWKFSSTCIFLCNGY